MESIQFLGDDPGAVTFGNFINYYQFHPPEERLKVLPNHFWTLSGAERFMCLDIGCNTGELTTKIYESIIESFQEKMTSEDPKRTCFMLGLDIDPTLIERAQEMNKYKDNILFKSVDFMSECREQILQEFLLNCDVVFDVIFCFSTTMWIHLNHGDGGLKKFLTDIAGKCKMLVIEPQPWKCYKSAVKRLKRCQQTFPWFSKIKIRENVDKFVENFLTDVCQLKKVYESDETKWGRKVFYFQMGNKQQS